MKRPGSRLQRSGLLGAAVCVSVATTVFLLVRYNVAAANIGAANTTTPTAPSGPTETTSPTPTVPPPPGESAVVSPNRGLSQLVPSNPPQVAIMPTAACSNAELAASVTDYGLRSMNLIQDIVTVT